jgi:hypothetical protein
MKSLSMVTLSQNFLWFKMELLSFLSKELDQKTNFSFFQLTLTLETTRSCMT